MADSYKNALRKSTQGQQQQQSNEKPAGDESGKAKNAKPQDIVRLYDIIIQVRICLFLANAQKINSNICNKIKYAQELCF
jgi:hypothetical protein